MDTTGMTVLRDAWRRLVPDLDSRHGPLPPLLIALTVVSGLVDAFSYLILGHVFVANMTGNVVFVAFGIAGAPGFSIAASLVALAALMMMVRCCFSRMGRRWIPGVRIVRMTCGCRVWTSLEAMRHVLALFDYPDKDREIASPPDPLIVGSAALLSEHITTAQRILPRLSIP